MHLILIAIVFQNLYATKLKTISCEYISSFDYKSKTFIKECYMFNTSSIDALDTIFFTRDNAMESVAMDHNKKIFYLPLKIGDAFINLVTLRAGNCSIKEVSRQNFIGSRNLKYLNLEHNQINKVESGTFESLTTLNELYLAYNKMQSIAKGSFKGMLNLKNLNLGFNQIAMIASGTFEGLVNCNDLYLAYNKIQTVANKAFKGMPKLKKLFLDNNQIVKIPSDTFEGLNMLEEIFLCKKI